MKNRSNYSKHNQVRLVQNGLDFITLNIEIIKKAKYFIWFHTYIFDDDEVTKPFIHALKEKAQEGIKIFFLVDGFGSRFLTDNFIKDIKQAGIEFNWFSPIFSTKMHHIGRRLHSKILLIDNKILITGGINHSKKFCSPQKDNPWLDYSILLEGEEVFEITKRYFNLYSKHFDQIKKSPNNYLFVPFLNYSQKCLVRTIENDWMRFKNQIYHNHVQEITKAKKRIVILATYFFPGKKVLNELKNASIRGVEISLIFTKRSDHPLERWSSKYLYSWFLSQNIKIYEWGNSIVHGKIILFDNTLCSIGSYNHNFMGHYGNIELNLDILDKNFGLTVKNELDEIIKNSEQISLEQLESSHYITHRILETFSFIFANLITFISLWFVNRKYDDQDEP